MVLLTTLPGWLGVCELNLVSNWGCRFPRDCFSRAPRQGEKPCHPESPVLAKDLPQMFQAYMQPVRLLHENVRVLAKGRVRTHRTVAECRPMPCTTGYVAACNHTVN